MISLEDKRKITDKGKYDVVVVGGGIGGVAAAVSSARNGAKTVLIEKQINLGGLATGGLISWYEPLCDGEGNQLSFGIAEELLRLSIKYGFEDLDEKWGGEGKYHSHTDRFATHFSPGVFALVLDDFLMKNGVDIRFDTMATYPVMEENICKGVVAETSFGKEYFAADAVIDATGTAELAHLAGLPTENGDNWCIYIAHGLEKSNLEEYHTYKNIGKLHKWYSCGADYAGGGNFEGVPTMNGVTSDQVNDFIRIGKSHFVEKMKKGNKNSRDIYSVPTMPQFRKIRRIIGNYTFTGEDSLYGIEDSIGRCGYFAKSGERYKLPFGILFNSDFPNILAAGRTVSATGKGWEITRVIPVCAVTGEAAGTAAALCSKSGKNLNEISVKDLQKRLMEFDVKI